MRYDAVKCNHLTDECGLMCVWSIQAIASGIDCFYSCSISTCIVHRYQVFPNGFRDHRATPRLQVYFIFLDIAGLESTAMCFSKSIQIQGHF